MTIFRTSVIVLVVAAAMCFQSVFLQGCQEEVYDYWAGLEDSGANKDNPDAGVGVGADGGQ